MFQTNADVLGYFYLTVVLLPLVILVPAKILVAMFKR